MHSTLYPFIAAFNTVTGRQKLLDQISELEDMCAARCKEVERLKLRTHFEQVAKDFHVDDLLYKSVIKEVCDDLAPYIKEDAHEFLEDTFKRLDTGHQGAPFMSARAAYAPDSRTFSVRFTINPCHTELVIHSRDISPHRGTIKDD